MVIMADITITFSDGSTHVYENVPGNVSREQILQRASSDFANKSIADVNRVSYGEMGAMEVGERAAKAFPKSLGKMVGDIASAITSPIQTGKVVLDVAAGALQNILPESVVQAIGEDKASREAANAVAQMYKQRYGSTEEVKKLIATDPAAFMADVSTVLTGGAMATARAPAIAAPLSAAAGYVDPLSLVAKTGAAAVKGVGAVAPSTLGMTTGVGREAIEQAYAAGKEGGARATQFAENLRGKANMTDVLDIAKQNLEQLRSDRSAIYKSNMQNIKGDTTILDFAGIDKALQSAESKVLFKGQVKNVDAAERLNEVRKMVNDWKSLNPADFHTPEGLDALKQQIGQVLEKTTPRTQSDLVVKEIYNAIKSEINRQAPTYSKTMKAYSEASDQILEIERALSLGNKASVDTAMRKLQSLMRNNVSTNYGQRLQLARELEEKGGQQMMPALAGQALSELAPRGLQRATAPFLGGMGLYLGGPATGVAGAAISSPRLMGEAAYGAGTAARGLLGAAQAAPDINYQGLLNMLYQAEQMRQ